MERTVVYEANEVPLGVLQWYADQNPASVIARLLKEGRVSETINTDDLFDRELYPSQTWATLSMGVPLEKHNVYWYADPKPEEFPLYWQTAAQTRSVGVVGALHSSPLDTSRTLQGLKFCVPDSFAENAETLPARLEGLQRFSLSMTSRNARAVGSTFPALDYMRGLIGVLRAGVGVGALTRLVGVATRIAAGRVPKERLRTAHAVLMFAVFVRQMKRFDPDLGVFFSNHVAAAMHRFWFASFPDDWEAELYDADWVERNVGELPAALDELDRQLDWLLDFCARSDRKLVLVSSMGQHGGEPLRDKSDQVFVVRSAGGFLQAIGLRSARERAAMVPQISAEMSNAEEALAERDRLHGEYAELRVDVAGPVITITYDLTVSDGKVVLGGVERSPVDIGGEAIPVDEHRNGMHHPVGVLISYPYGPSGDSNDLVNTLEVAPALLTALGVPTEPHHVTPSFTL